MPPIKESVRDDDLAYYNRVRHYNRAAVDGVLKAVGEKLDVLIINVEDNTMVPDHESDITLLPKSPPLPPPKFAPTLQLPKTTKTMRQQWMDESTVRIMSCPATRFRNSDGMDAIDEFEDIGSVDDRDADYMEIGNALPGCLIQLTSSLLKTTSARRKLSVSFDIINRDVIKAPQYVADPYRAASISKILSLPGVIDLWWWAVPYRHASRIVPPRTKKHVRPSARTRLTTTLLQFAEPCVDNTPYPVWPEYVDEVGKFAFGWYPFPDRHDDWDTSLGAYISKAAMTSLGDMARPGLAIDHIVEAICANIEVLARNRLRDDADQVSKWICDADVLTDAMPLEVPNITTARNATKTGVGRLRARTLCAHILTRGPGPAPGLPAHSHGLGRRQQDP
jgi:hypothetical protein